MKILVSVLITLICSLGVHTLHLESKIKNQTLLIAPTTKSPILRAEPIEILPDIQELADETNFNHSNDLFPNDKQIIQIVGNKPKKK